MPKFELPPLIELVQLYSVISANVAFYRSHESKYTVSAKASRMDDVSLT